METETKKNRTKEDVERELNLKKDQIEHRLAALQEEVSTVGPSIRDALINHPLVSVGGAMLAGLLVGLIFGGRKRPTEVFGTDAGHRALVDHYVGTIAEEARHRIADGQDVDAAVRAAMEARVPLIVYEASGAGSKMSVVSLLAGLVLRQLLPLGIKAGLDYLQVESDEEAGQGAPGGEDPAPMP